MRKLISLTLIATVLSLVVGPALVVASGPYYSPHSVTTQFSLGSGGTGSPPIIKAKWETPDDADTSHTIRGTQVKPSGQKDVPKPVCVWAVVTDPQGVDTVKHVYADVSYPMVPLEPPHTSEGCGVLIQQIELSKIGCQPTTFSTYAGQDLVWYSGDYNFDKVMFELEKCTAYIYKGCLNLSYEDPAGDYTVEVQAVDTYDEWSNILENTFDYVPVTIAEFDFTTVNYGSVNLGVRKMVAGDTTWGNGIPTVRNVGNTNLQVTVQQDDMGLGKTGTKWNVHYDARMGNSGTTVYYDPGETATLPNVLGLSLQDELDFSILVDKAISGKTGSMTLGVVYADFDECGD